VAGDTRLTHGYVMTQLAEALADANGCVEVCIGTIMHACMQPMHMYSTCAHHCMFRSLQVT
jgi:hypothetical protein